MADGDGTISFNEFLCHFCEESVSGARSKQHADIDESRLSPTRSTAVQLHPALHPERVTVGCVQVGSLYCEQCDASLCEACSKQMHSRGAWKAATLHTTYRCPLFWSPLCSRARMPWR